MKAIVLTDDELIRLEKTFGPSVRLMGPWSSDGTFGYSSIPIIAVEKAAEALDNPNLMEALSRLTDTPERAKAFIELLEVFGTGLMERIVDAYRQCAMAGHPPSPKPPQTETRRSSLRILAG